MARARGLEKGRLVSVIRYTVPNTRIRVYRARVACQLDFLREDSVATTWGAGLKFAAWVAGGVPLAPAGNRGDEVRRASFRGGRFAEQRVVHSPADRPAQDRRHPEHPELRHRPTAHEYG